MSHGRSFSFSKHFENFLHSLASDVKKNYPITGLDRALGLREFEVPRISRQSAHEGSEVVNSTRRPPLPTGDTLVLIFVAG